MRAVLSIVIPTLNAGEALPGCVAGLMEGLEVGLIRELIVTDGGSDDATKAIAEEVGAVLVSGAASRGGQMRRGAGLAKGDWMLFLHADTQLAPGWSAAVLDHIAQAGPELAGFFRLGFDSGGVRPRIVSGWANLRARLLGLPFGDQGLLISRARYEASGGFADIPLMEDVALARALGRRRLKMLPVTARTSARRYATEGWFRRGARNLGLQIRYLCGASPERLAQRYRRSDRQS